MRKLLLLAVAASLLSGCVVNPRPMSEQERVYWQMQANQNAYDAAHNRGLWAPKHHHHNQSPRVVIWQPAPQYDYGHHHHGRMGSYDNPIRFHAQMAKKHRRELQRKHCTQVDEANGKC